MMRARSADGTAIAYERAGDGPPLILVGGAFCDRSARAAGTPLATLLAPRFTVFSYDRRGRGDSGDTRPYATAREVDDLDALIAAAGGSAYVYGLSAGGLLALEAAVRPLRITGLALYEPPFVLGAGRSAFPEDLPAQLMELAASGRRSEAIELFMTRAVDAPAPVLAQMRRAQIWGGLDTLAHTLAYDARIAADGPALLARASSVRAPTLVIDGGESPAWMRHGVRALASAIPGARTLTLEGQTHDVDPKALAGALGFFFEAFPAER